MLRVLPLALAAAHLTVASLPCFAPEPGGETTVAVATAAATQGHAHHPHHHDGEGVATPSSEVRLRRPCPCGCEGAAPSAAGAAVRLGTTVPPVGPQPLPAASVSLPDPVACRALAPARRPIDHVPRHLLPV